MTLRFSTDSVASMLFLRRLTGGDDLNEFLVPSSPIKIDSVFSEFNVFVISHPRLGWQFASSVILELKFLDYSFLLY